MFRTQVEREIAALHQSRGGKSFPCTHAMPSGEPCVRRFANPKSMRQHVTAVHPGINRKLFLCPAHGCPRRFMHASSLRRHQGADHGVGVLPVFLEAPRVLKQEEL